MGMMEKLDTAEKVRTLAREYLTFRLGAEHYGKDRVATVAKRADAHDVIFPMAPGTVPGVDDYVALVDTWVSRLAAAFRP